MVSVFSDSYLPSLARSVTTDAVCSAVDEVLSDGGYSYGDFAHVKYSEGKAVYVRPEKVWNRESETMFLPHLYNPENGSFKPLLDGIRASRFYQVMNRQQRPGSEQSTDSWDRFFNLTRQMHEAGMDVSDSCDRMCRIMMTRDEKTPGRICMM